MDKLVKFVTAWEKTGRIEDILGNGLDLPPPGEVGSYLSSLPPADRDRIKTSLEQALAAFSDHTSRMEAEAVALKDQIDLSIQASNACISYNKRPKKERS